MLIINNYIHSPPSGCWGDPDVDGCFVDIRAREAQQKAKD